MTLQFARRVTDKVPRQTHFLSALPSLHHACLPESKDIAHLAAVQSSTFKTTRLRPEIWAMIEALKARFKATRKVDLTVSEIVAAVMIEGLPSLMKREDFAGSLPAQLTDRLAE